MPVATPELIVEAFAINGDKNVIPVDSQIGITNGAASYNDGFPPLTRTSPSAGGVPPAGKDVQGILYAISSYCAYLQGGGIPPYSLDFSNFNGGYAKGALLGMADGTGFWFNLQAGNGSDPDSVGPNFVWLAIRPPSLGYVSVNIGAGTHNDYNPTGFDEHTGVMDLDPTAGDATITGFPAGADGQRMIVTNMNATNLLNLASLTGSSPANQIRLPTTISLTQYGSITLQYAKGPALWLPA